MKKVVLLDAYRPLIPERWDSDTALKQVTKLIKECWNQNAAARLPALRIKKNLVAVLGQIKQNEF
jgi:activin receptor type-1